MNRNPPFYIMLLFHQVSPACLQQALVRHGRWSCPQKCQSPISPKQTCAKRYSSTKSVLNSPWWTIYAKFNLTTGGPLRNLGIWQPQAHCFVQGPWWHRSSLWDYEVQPDLRIQLGYNQENKTLGDSLVKIIGFIRFPCFCRWTTIIHLDVRRCEDPILFDLTPKLVSSKELEHFPANQLAVLVLPYWFSAEVTQVVGTQFYTSLALTLCWTVWSNLDSRIATKVVKEGCGAGTFREGIKPPTLRDQDGPGRMFD